MPRSRSSGANQTEPAFVAQESLLLGLPPELRNTVYEYVCSNIDTITLLPTRYPKISATNNAVSQTCRQLRREFPSVFSVEAPLSAKNIVSTSRNFDTFQDRGFSTTLEAREYEYRNAIGNFLLRLPVLPNGQGRTLVQVIILDNTFESNNATLSAVKSDINPMHSQDSHRPVEIRTVVKFDSRTFDVDYLGRFIPRLSNGRVPRGVPAAMVDAIEKHDLAQARLAAERARKRRLAAKQGEAKDGKAKCRRRGAANGKGGSSASEKKKQR